MNNYVVAFLSFHTNEIHMQEVLADSKLDAALKYLYDSSEWDTTGVSSLDELDDLLANGDCVINVLNISRTGRPGDGLQTHLTQFDSAARFQ